MKYLLHSLLLTAIATAALAGCNPAADNGDTPLERAQNAYGQKRYVRAQTICDSILLGNNFPDLNVCQLTELSLLLMRLGEHSNDADINTAFAARCIKAAWSRDSDSTNAIIRQLPSEDQGRVMILTALNEASERINETDSLAIPADSIPDNEL